MSRPVQVTKETTLLIRGGTIIAFDGTEHRYLEGGVLAVAGDSISYVGERFEATDVRTIDATGKIVIPGQISTHAHIGAHEGPRLLIDSGRREFVRSGFLHFLPSARSGAPGFLAEQDARASLRYGFATLLRHGVTTVLAFAPAGQDGGEGMLEVANEFGIRLVWTPIIYGGRYWLGENGTVEREFDEALGMRMLRHAAEFIERHRRTNDGRLSGVIVVDEFYTSSPTLRREAKAVARSLGVPFSMHFVEQHREFFETMTRTGRTPAQLLAEEEVLDDATILAHSIYLAHHSLVGYPVEDDLAILGHARATVAHSPVAFARRGVALESFDRYRRAGVTVALGTDTYPLDMFSEMRTASQMGKLVDRSHEAAPAAAVFAASNIAGSQALGRGDLGRIAVGAKADIVIVDARSLAFGPNPDPLRALVHLATPDMVDTVIIGGRVVLEGKRLQMADEERILEDARRSSDRVWGAYAKYDHRGRTVCEAFPPALPTWEAS